MDALREMEIIPDSNGSMPAGCACGEVLKGLKIPTECALFRSCCTPDNPIGPCIISSEGTCAAYYKYAVE
jgi:hydrogenase expression/formation protein HypD